MTQLFSGSVTQLASSLHAITSPLPMYLPVTDAKQAWNCQCWKSSSQPYHSNTLALQSFWHSSYTLSHCCLCTLVFLPRSSHEPISSGLLYLYSAGVVQAFLHLRLMNCYNLKEPQTSTCICVYKCLGQASSCYYPKLNSNNILSERPSLNAWSNYSPLSHEPLLRSFTHCLLPLVLLLSSKHLLLPEATLFIVCSHCIICLFLWDLHFLRVVFHWPLYPLRLKQCFVM